MALVLHITNQVQGCRKRGKIIEHPVRLLVKLFVGGTHIGRIVPSSFPAPSKARKEATENYESPVFRSSPCKWEDMTRLTQRVTLVPFNVEKFS